MGFDVAIGVDVIVVAIDVVVVGVGGRSGLAGESWGPILPLPSTTTGP